MPPEKSRTSSNLAIAIDFGNTRTKVAYRDQRRGESKLVEGLGKRVSYILPSLFYVEDEDPPKGCPDHQLVTVTIGSEEHKRRLYLGDDARAKGDECPARLIQRLKLDIHDTIPIRLKGKGKVRRIDLATGLFAHIKAYCEKHLPHLQGKPIECCHLTVPADFAIEKEEKIVEAAKSAGFSQCKTIAEPDAAARHWLRGQDESHGNWVIVCDVGGGTTDLALLGRDKEGQFRKNSEIPPRSIEKGGLHVDETIWEKVLDLRLDKYNESEEIWWGFKPYILTWLGETRESNDRDSQKSAIFPIDGEQPDLEVAWSLIQKCENDFHGIVANELKRFVERCAGSTGEKKIPVLLAGGGSLMPRLHEALNKAIERKVHVWDQSQYATVLGAVEIPTPEQTPGTTPVKTPAEQYEQALRESYKHKRIEKDKKDLQTLKNQLGLPATDALAIERKVLGQTLNLDKKKSRKKEASKSETSQHVHLRCIRALANMFVCTDQDKGSFLFANRDNPSEWETFEMTELEDNKFFLKTHQNRYVSLNNENYLHGFDMDRGEKHLFTRIDIGEEELEGKKYPLIAIRASNGKYLQAGTWADKLIADIEPRDQRSCNMFIIIPKGKGQKVD
jgi:hypothetical protein